MKDIIIFYDKYERIDKTMMMLVECISERETMPGQITVGEKYWIDRDSIFIDQDGDAYGTVYSTSESKRIGVLKLSHFKSVHLNYDKYGTGYDKTMMMFVECISEAKESEYITVGRRYWIDHIYIDQDGDAYGTVYFSTQSIFPVPGFFKLSHFKSILS